VAVERAPCRVAAGCTAGCGAAGCGARHTNSHQSKGVRPAVLACRRWLLHARLTSGAHDADRAGRRRRAAAAPDASRCGACSLAVLVNGLGQSQEPAVPGQTSRAGGGAAAGLCAGTPPRHTAGQTHTQALMRAPRRPAVAPRRRREPCDCRCLLPGSAAVRDTAGWHRLVNSSVAWSTA